MSRDHGNVKAFQLADSLALQVYVHTRKYPKEELFGLTSQMRRAAVSVAANIVEGCARTSERELLHALNIALGSLRELGYYVELSGKLGYLEPVLAESLDHQYDETPEYSMD